MAKQKRNKLIGLEGWLALFIVGQILALLLTVFRFFADGFLSSSDIAILNEHQSGLGDTLQSLTAFESVAIFVYVGLIITTLVLLFNKRKIAKPFAIATLLFAAVYGLIDYLVASSVFASSGLSGNVEIQAMMSKYGSDVGRSIVGAFIWVPYFIVSKRVKATLTRTSDNSIVHATAQKTAKIKDGERYGNDSSPRSQRIVKIAMAVIVLFIVLGFAVLVAGGQFFRWHEKVVQESRPATFRQENTGSYDISYTQRWICGGGADYLSCVNSHVTLYNSICVGKSLTATAESTCNDLLKFVNDTKQRSATCGYNCTTQADSSGHWGWQYLDLVPETHQVSNNDGVEEATRPAVCVVKIGWFAIGECSEE